MAPKNPKSNKGASAGEKPDEAPPAPKFIKLKIKRVTVVLAHFSQTYRLLSAQQFKEGKTKKQGTIALGDQILVTGRPYELEMTSEVQALIKKNVFQVIRSTIYGRKKR